MQCKYCQAEMEEGNSICPVCGEDNEESSVSKKLKVMKILTFSFIGAVLLCVLVSLVSYGTSGRFLPGFLRKNDINYKKSYSVSLETLDTGIGNSSFMSGRDTVVATVGERELTNRMLQVYYWDLVSRASFADLDKNEPLDTQYYDPDTEKTWQQYFIEVAIETWMRDMLVLDMADEAGFEMPEVYVTQFDTLEKDMLSTAVSKGYTTLEEFLKEMTGTGTTFEIYYEFLWTYFMGGSYWKEYIETLEVDMADIEAYYEKNKSSLMLDDYFQVTKDTGKLVDVRHILIQPEQDIKDEDGKATGSSEEAWEACRVKAQEILDQWLAGDADEDAFAALATEKTEDGGSKSSGGLYTDVWPGRMVEAFNDWCFDENRQSGDYGLVKTSYGYHIMYFVGAEEGWIRMCTTGAQSDKASEIIDGIVENTTINVNYKKIAIADME